MYKNGFNIYTLQENNGSPAFSLLFSGDYPNMNTCVYFGDFNGDGKTDLLTQNVVQYGGDDDNETAIHISKGNSFETKVLPYMQKYLATLHIGDYNGDGKSDFACYYQKEDKFIIGFSDSQTFVETKYSGRISNNVNVIVSDFYGDGRDNIMENSYYIPSGSSKMSLFAYGKNDENSYIKEIKNGLNQSIQINYKSTTDPTVYSCSNHSYTYPVCFFSKALKVVASYHGRYNTNMKYSNAKAHLQGKGFLGFESVEASNLTQNKIVKTISGYDNSFFIPYSIKQTETTLDGGPISSINFTNKITSLGGKRTLTYVSEEKHTDHLTGLSNTVKIISMDDTGNPLTIQNTKGGITETKTLNYIQKGSWCKNKISHITSTAKSLEGGTVTRTIDMEYDEKGNNTKITKDLNDLNCIVSKFSYDTFGNEIQIDNTTNGKTRTNKKEYNSSGCLLIKETNELNQTTTYEWDQSRDLVLNKINYQGLTTRYKYDDFGQLIETQHPDGTREGQRMLWSASIEDPENAHTYRYTQASGSAPDIVWYDWYGDEMQRDSYGLNGNKISVITEYALDGTLSRKSEPFFEGNTIIWAEIYSYDKFRRPISVITPRGTVTTTYDGISTTVTSPEGTKRAILNTAGQILRNIYNGKEVYYTYYPTGKTKTVTPEGRPTISLEYDLQGNRTKLIDPDAGTIYNEYNGIGEMISEKQMIHLDQDDIITSYTYHENGLLQQVSRNGENTNYTYDSQKRLQSVNIQGQHKQEYIYDDLNRVINVKENIQGKTFTQITEYDRLGRIKKEIYPSGITLRTHMTNMVI